MFCDKEFSLRPAQAKDSPAIRTLIYQVGINPIGLDWRRFILAVDSQDHMIGCGQVKPHRDGSLELASIAVRQGCRHRGVATAIIRRLLENHPRPLFLTCRMTLGPFYERFGFHEVEFENQPDHFRSFTRIVHFLHRWKILAFHLFVMKLDD